MTTTFHITCNETPFTAKEFSSREDAIASFCAPDYAGDSVKSINVDSDGKFSYRGDRYQIREGRNIKAIQAEVAAEKITPVAKREQVTTRNLAYHMYNSKGRYYG